MGTIDLILWWMGIDLLCGVIQMSLPKTSVRVTMWIEFDGEYTLKSIAESLRKAVEKHFDWATVDDIVVVNDYHPQHKKEAEQQQEEEENE